MYQSPESYAPLIWPGLVYIIKVPYIVWTLANLNPILNTVVNYPSRPASTGSFCLCLYMGLDSDTEHTNTYVVSEGRASSSSSSPPLSSSSILSMTGWYELATAGGWMLSGFLWGTSEPANPLSASPGLAHSLGEGRSGNGTVGKGCQRC